MRKKGSIIRIILFMVIMLITVHTINNTMIPKRSDGIIPMKAYYDQPSNSVDVLVLGSSHAGMNLSAQTLWEEYGIASFMLWGSMQPFWNSYFDLVEALKTQSPKVIVLETTAAKYDFEFSDDARQVTNLEGMHLSKNKMEAIKVTSPKERWGDMISLLPLIHDRYDELTEIDFHYYSWNDLQNDKGSREIRYSINNNVPQVNAEEITEVKPLFEKEERYLRKIIELCREKNLDLVLFTTPDTFGISNSQPYYNRVAEIAEEYNVTYINCNLLEREILFDRMRDFVYNDSHLNTMGVRKVTRYLGKYLKENYELPDRRGQKGFESWDVFSREREAQYIPIITDTADYMTELSSRKYLYYLIKNSSWEISESYKSLEEQFLKIGFDNSTMEGGGGTWTLDTTAGKESPIKQFNGDMLNPCTASGVDFCTDFRAGKDGGTGEVTVNGEVVYHLRGPGIILLVYDLVSQECIDISDFLVQNDFKMTHP